VVAPLAVSVAVSPTQIVGLFTDTEREAPTVTTDWAVPEHPEVVPVTVYVVVDAGDVVTGLPVPRPPLHE
jgi:hypothetical protein